MSAIPPPVALTPVPTHCSDAPALLIHNLPLAPVIVLLPNHGVATVALEILIVPPLTVRRLPDAAGEAIVITRVTSKIAVWFVPF